MADIFLDKALINFNALTKKPEKFLSEPNNLIESSKNLLKENYDFLKKEENENKLNTLRELIVKDFDVEQIWQQIELQNNKLLDASLLHVSKLIAAKDTSLWFDIKNDRDETEEFSSNEDSDGENKNENDDYESDDILEDGHDHFSSDNNSDLKDDIKKVKTQSFKKHKKSIVDDDFFKLDEMEQFLKQEEQGKPKKKKNINSEESESEDESIDLFISDIDDHESEDESNLDPKYNDFFEHSDEENESKGEVNVEDNEKSIDDIELALSDLDVTDDEKSDEEIDDHNNVHKVEDNLENDKDDDDLKENNNKDKEEIKSSLEIREERLKKKIDQIENAALQEKSWQLKGEVTASNRPQNSLLEEVVEFDLTTRPAPIITQETTYKLEDLIKQRIKDKVFDSVERKIKPVEAPNEYKKKLVLDQEKSKQSLAQIYETEYLKQKEALDPNPADKEEEIPKEHIEIKKLMKSLFSKLDALSNFHFTPKQVVPELKIVNNLPAITMEEVAPSAISDAALLAPEEIKNKPKGDLIGRGERTKTDKKRDRRKKKQKQKVHAVEKQKKDQIAESKPGKFNKKKAATLIQKITKDRNISKMNENSKAVKSSTAFFSQLEDEVKGHINSKQKRKHSTDKPQLVAKKIKL